MIKYDSPMGVSGIRKPGSKHWGVSLQGHPVSRRPQRFPLLPLRRQRRFARPGAVNVEEVGVDLPKPAKHRRLGAPGLGKRTERSDATNGAPGLTTSSSPSDVPYVRWM